MTDLIGWLDQHQGSVMALLTAVYVIATIWLALLMRRSNRLAGEALQRSMEYQKETTRPYVVFDLEDRADDDLLVATLKNIGQRSAHNVRVTTEPRLYTVDPEQAKKIGRGIPAEGLQCVFTQNQVPFLPPGRNILEHIDDLSTFLQKNRDRAFQVQIEYSDSRGETYKESSQINLSYFWWRQTLKKSSRTASVSGSRSSTMPGLDS
jgi:hypothetical protein